MFERFTRPARDAVVTAQEQARTTGASRVDTRHLLLALITDSASAWRAAGSDPSLLTRALQQEIRSSGLDREALAGIGIDLDAVSEQADQVFGPDALLRAGRRSGRIPFSRDAKKALELALREAVRLHARSIGSHHLLLGVIRAECPGRAVLVRADVDLAALRHALEGPASASA